MLAVRDAECIAFYFDEEGGDYCRACALKELGEVAVARVAAGLHHADWSPVTRWEMDEQAIERGYDCDVPEHHTPKDTCCSLCRESLCYECGARLDSFGAHAWL